MSTEVTANVMIGPLRVDSTHGRSSFGTSEGSFAPSHTMVLIEGRRATWVVQRCPNLGRPTRTLTIRPSSPEYLLAAALLGYLALTMPTAIQGSDDLGRGIEADIRRGQARIRPVDYDLARRVFAHCGERTCGLVTTLPGSSITPGELKIAEAAGMRSAIVTASG